MSFKCKICKADYEADDLGMVIGGKRYCFSCVAKAVRLLEEALEQVENDEI
jgi:hypothetical protein